MKSDGLIKSSVEDLVHTPSESDGISESESDLPVCDDSSPKKDEIIDTDILLTIKDDILREKLLKVNLLIAKIEALKDNPTPSSDFTSSGSTTTHADISLPEYDSFHLDSEPDSGDFTMDVVEDIFDNPTREQVVMLPNVLHHPFPPIHLIRISLFLGFPRIDLMFFLPEMKNKIFDPGLCIEVESRDFLLLLFPRGGKNNCPNFEASHARGFILRSLELQILSFIMGIQYPNLID
ncbi:hypothetical protein Tco_0246104 [Tanacetum coccineum]